MRIIIRLLVATAVCVLLVAMVAAADDQTVKVDAEWKGGSTLPTDNEAWKKAPANGAIVTAEAWTKLWKDWQFTKELPGVNFEKELVLVAAGGGPNAIAIQPLKLTADGDLKFQWTVTTKAGAGFVCHLLKIQRDGIKSINGKPLPGT